MWILEPVGAGWVIEARVENSRTARLRDLPSIDTVLNTAAATVLRQRFGRAASTGAVHAALAQARAELQAGESSVPTAEDFVLQALARLDGEDRSGLRPLFNLTGTVLHTNLGRAVLAEAAIEAAVAAMRDPGWRWNSTCRRASAASATAMCGRCSGGEDFDGGGFGERLVLQVEAGEG